MKRLKKIVIWLVSIAFLLYVGVIALYYFNQERILFRPMKLKPDFAFNFNDNVEELTFQVSPEVALSGALFKTKESTKKGLIFYLHGNTGNLNTWRNSSSFFNKMGYDCFILDYRGFGKSQGSISDEASMYSDVEYVYNKVRNQYNYDESDITVYGYSIGTGPAAYLSQKFHPKKLYLQAPYNNLEDLRQIHFAWIPAFCLKYQFPVDQFIANNKLPIQIIHGDQDKNIPIDCSYKLKKLFDENDSLFVLKGNGHQFSYNNPEYAEFLISNFAESTTLKE